MNIKSFLQPILLGLIAILLTSCDKDFDELGTDIVGNANDHFDLTRDVSKSVKAYNQPIGTVASNNLPVNPLGSYYNPAFGTTQANFVTQVELATVNPVFNNTDTELYEKLPKLDSVVLDIPYFNRAGTVGTDGVTPYTLDSIYGVNETKFKLHIYESKYYLRDLDPDQALAEQQLFYTDKDAEIDANKNPQVLNDTLITTGTNSENEQFFFDKREHKTTKMGDDGVTPVVTRSVPSMRLHLNRAYFYNLILNAPSGKLSSNSVFKDYFRGLYFKTETAAAEGNMAMLNFKAGKITLFYKEDKKTAVVGSNPLTYTYPRVNKTYVLNLSGNTVSLLNNSFDNSNYLTAMANPTLEAEKLYLKGGSGSMAVIDLFGSTDVKKTITNSLGKLELVDGSNGVSDELDEIKVNSWLINEANLTFYIDHEAPGLMQNTKTREPNRVYLYDLTHKKPLIDYTTDFTTNGAYPKYNKYIYGGIFAKEDGTLVNQRKDEKGTYYKIRITNHVRNLLLNDSTNVKLGLVVSENISNIGFLKRKSPGSDAVIQVPTMSVMSPLGTILYGSSPAVIESKRLKLEIYYTKSKQSN